ncbi:MAG: sigma-70 family RNA polymerase sigma factor [Bythopirellula sp.]|nr:sigma-70 family RNA polymerase sigma factor [Bythopirellula sp.]
MEQTLKQPTTTVLLPAIAITDGELLMRYARHGDEAAFATLVEKHGRLVWTVCWQVLRQHHEIEDAFQSTFFILAKRARSIRSCDSLCGWLYRVAYRTALRSRLAAKPKPMTELVAEELSSLDDKLQAIEQYEQRALLLEELHALPEKYQQPLVLCYLEGKSRRAIAEELGCSLETIKGRLARGRQVLRHRLIRRGVSLSLAMGAMALPIKFATAAVTPKLVGLTVTGAAGWAAGAAAAAKVASTVSSQVIHLAQQGTVAMTIASFAKPAVLAVALLGAASATLAVNSSDQAPIAQGSQVVDLQAEAEAASASADDERAIEIVVAKEVVVSDPQPVPKATTEKPRQPAPLRAPQPPKNRSLNYAEVMIPTPPEIREVPAAVANPFNIRIPSPMSLEILMKDAELETKVVQLQLEGKELEIAAFDEIGKKKEELLKQAKKRLLMAEAEQLKIQIERRRAQLKELEQALEQQAEGLGRQAERIETEAHLTAEQAKEIAVEQAARGAYQAQQFGQQPQETITYPSYLPDTGLQPGDQIKIEVEGAFPDRPINGIYVIEPTGTVALGASYGRAKIVGMSVLDAEQAILEQLKKIVDDPLLQVTLVGRGDSGYAGRGGYGGGYGGSSTLQPARQPSPKK